MKALKIKIAIFLAVAVSTFILTQGFYRGNIGMLNDSLSKSLEIVEEMHNTESFHSAMHSMIINAAAFLHSGDESYKREYEARLQEGEKAVARLQSLRPGLASGEPALGESPPVSEETAGNIAVYFEEFKRTLAPVIAGNAANPRRNLALAQRLFDEVFHKYYVRLHTANQSRLAALKSDARHIYERSNAIYFAQLVIAVGVGIFLLVFAERMFLKIYKITERHSLTDSLTALHNRRYLDTVVRDELSRGRLKGIPCSLVFLDVDDFKKFNDSYGHPAGDELLKELATILKRSVRQTDRVIRYGGEEFLVVLPGADMGRATAVAEKIRTTIEAHLFQLPDGTRSRVVTASLGVATLAEDDGGFAQAVEAADALLYRAKREGKNKVHCVSEETCPTVIL